MNNMDRSPAELVADNKPLSAAVVLEWYAYPGELDSLAKLARQFVKDDSALDAASVLCDALVPLIDGLEAAGYGELDFEYEPWWHPLLERAVDALENGDAMVEAWRMYGELLADERSRVLRAAREDSGSNGPG